MSEITFTYGGQKIVLKKSESLIAVKPKSGLAGSLRPRTRSLDAPDPNIPDKLGEFELIPVAATRSLDGGSATDNTLHAFKESGKIVAGVNVYHPEGSTIPMVPTGEIYIVFKDSIFPQDCLNEIAKHSLEVIEKRAERTFIVRVTEDSSDPISSVVALQQSGNVKIAEPDLSSPMVFSFTLPDDSLFSKQWHMKNSGVDFRDTAMAVFSEAKEGADARIIDAWQELDSMGSSAIVLAIIDNGFDLDHPDFGGSKKVVHPYDFSINSPRMERGPTDTHGTLVAGVALARANGLGIVGVAPHTRLMPIRNKAISDGDMEALFERVSTMGADIINCSWGFPQRNHEIKNDPSLVAPISTRMKEAVRKAAIEGRNGLGCIICFATGNHNRQITDFAKIPEVIAVGASTSKDERADYSNYGPEISILAPSGGATPIISTFVTDGVTTRGLASVVSGGPTMSSMDAADLSDSGIGGEYRGFAGTSCSSPILAGVCALVLSANPNLTAFEVKEILEKTADKIDSANARYDAHGFSNTHGHGRVNALEAVREAKRRRTNMPEKPVITPKLSTLGTNMKGRIYTQNGYFAYKVDVGNDLHISIRNDGKDGADFEVFVKKDTPPTSLNDHLPPTTFSLDADTQDIVIPDVSPGSYYLIVKPKDNEGDFDLKVGLK
ncbi:S8 family serine peptidase [bacterium]|nr:S8 family serine peptidase [bacterium]